MMRQQKRIDRSAAAGKKGRLGSNSTAGEAGQQRFRRRKRNGTAGAAWVAATAGEGESGEGESGEYREEVRLRSDFSERREGALIPLHHRSQNRRQFKVNLLAKDTPIKEVLQKEKKEKKKKRKRKEKSENSTQKRRVSAAVHKTLLSKKEGEGVHHQTIIYRHALINTPLDHSQPPEKGHWTLTLTFEFMDNFYKKDLCEMKQLPNIGGFKEICR
ncbi:hypothetical protein LXL04_016991 [Taraxacum kok-saghyz]